MYELHDIVEMKKPHPCGANRWEIIRMGMDIKIECTGCGQNTTTASTWHNQVFIKFMQNAMPFQN